MMRMLSNKKNVKIISVIISGIFVLGVAGLAFMQMSSPAMASPTSDIAVVDLAKAIPEKSPIMEKARKTMEASAKELQDQFEKESAGMDNQQKQKLFMSFQQKMQEKQMEVQKAMEKEVKESIKAVADGKNLPIVLNKEVVLYGGNDITELVAKKIANLKVDDKAPAAKPADSAKEAKK